MKKEFIIFMYNDLEAQPKDSVYIKELPDGGIEKKQISQLSHCDDCLFVTFQPEDLISKMSEDMICQNHIIDLECMDKQIRQSSDFKPFSEKWSIPNMLATYLKEDERDWHSDEVDNLVESMALCYNTMKNISRNEWNRILKVELPVNRILYLAQKKGIQINIDDIESKCRELHKELYTLKNKIQLELEVMDDDVENYLSDRGINRPNLSKTEIEFQQRTYPELELFLEVEKKEKNLSILLMLAATYKRYNKCYPTYKGFGTSTGRITLRNPAMQNLSKRFRYLLEDKALLLGQRFVYVDFGQFEAGILAGLSNNDKFIDLYEKNQIYEELAKQIQGNRESAKIDFYRFIYGGNYSEKARPFFEKYDLVRLKDRLKEQAINNGYVESLLANRRIVKEDDRNANWLINHYIQGTGSLVFKQALINVYESYNKDVHLVLPMHDAALYIVSSRVTTDSIIEEFKKAFNRWIPNVTPVINKKNFFEAD